MLLDGVIYYLSQAQTKRISYMLNDLCIKIEKHAHTDSELKKND